MRVYKSSLRVTRLLGVHYIDASEAQRKAFSGKRNASSAVVCVCVVVTGARKDAARQTYA